MEKNRVAVLIPCYNEATTIAKVIHDFKQTLPEAMIYVYDNNSSDDTYKIAREAGAIVKKERRQGKGNVIRTMFREIEADCYLMVDGDDTYPAESAPQLVDAVLNEQVDMAIGDRLSSTYFTENKRMFHNSGNRIVRWAINTVFKSNITDIMTGYRCFSRLFVKNFPVLSKGFEIETEITIHALDKNYVLESYPIEYRDRPEGSTSKLNTVADGTKVLLTIFNLVREYRPLLFFGITSLILVLLSSILFIPVWIEYLKTGLVPRFPTLIVSGIILVLAMLAMVCGLILDSVNKKYRQWFELHLVSTNETPSKETEKRFLFIKGGVNRDH